MIALSVVALLFLAGFAFWLWMLVECATKEPSTGNDKLAWVIIIVFTNIVGAFIYYFVRHRPRSLGELDRRSFSAPG